MKKPLVTPNDRLSLTICCAVIFHGIVVLGLTFAPEDLPHRFEPMEIILVQDVSQLIDQAQAVAQFTAQGGGTTLEDDEFASTAPVVVAPQEDVEPIPGVAETKPNVEASEFAPTAEAAEVMPSADTAEIAVNPEPSPSSSDVVPEVLAVADAVVEDTVEQVTTDEMVEGDRALEEPKELPETPALPTHDTVAVLATIAEVAALSARLAERVKQKKQRLRKKFISASTKESKYALYMKLWTSKVENIGNLNYPAVAKEKKLSGTVIVDVALRSDGSVKDINIIKSSDYQILDEAVIRIVNLAAPYAPFSDEINAETDVLHITRTWKFSDKHLFK